MSGRADMQLACAQAREYLGAALDLIAPLPGLQDVSPQDAARAHELVTSYVQLAGEALNRFQEAARGA